jgi:hypothetical protein
MNDFSISPGGRNNETPDREAYPPRGLRPARPWAFVFLGVGLLIVIGLVVGGAMSLSGSKESVAAKTSRFLIVLNSMCSHNSRSFYGCVTDSPARGVITVSVVDPYDIGEAELTRAGADTGLWSSADAASMTRAMDGTRTTTDGRVSWTFDPDHGLKIVITVK